MTNAVASLIVAATAYANPTNWIVSYDECPNICPIEYPACTNAVEIPVVIKDANHKPITTNYVDVTELYLFIESTRRCLW